MYGTGPAVDVSHFLAWTKTDDHLTLAGNTTEARLLKDITFPMSVLHEAMAMDEAVLVLICHNAMYGCVIGFSGHRLRSHNVN
jgi:hypothetical protein